jgi:hypothetical protein
VNWIQASSFINVGVLFSLEEKWNYDIWAKMEESGCQHVERNKADSNTLFSHM